eukprot:jgi/Botrbrau1/13609/Bobra.0069s0006.1
MANVSIALGQYRGSSRFTCVGEPAHRLAPRSLPEARDIGLASPLAVVGSANVDYVWRVSRMPVLGETMDAESLSVFPGGKGANQAAAAAKLGYPTHFIGQVGADGSGSLLVDSLAGAGADTSLLRYVDGPSGSAVIFVQPDGQNCIVIAGGANTAAWDISEKAAEVLKSAGGILLQREIPEYVNIQVAEIGRSAGIPVMLDAGGALGPIDSALLRLVTILSPNETELERLTGRKADTIEEAEEAARALQANGVGTVLVKRGAQGSLLVPQEGPPVVQIAERVERVVDTTGAGDCFTAAFMVALSEGHPPPHCLRFAGMAAAICVSRAGAQPSMPSRSEVERALAAPQPR